MSEISRFYGIIIRMFHRKHMPPHFHAVYGEFEALVSIDTFAILRVSLPPRASGLVVEWATIHNDELKKYWQKAVKLQNLSKIEALKLIIIN